MEPIINSGKARVKLTGTGGDGFYVEVTPLTLATRQALVRKALELYPDPDAKQYEQSRSALGLAPAFGEEVSDVLAGEENPAYRAALAEVERKRNQWATDTAVDICVSSEHRDAYVSLYAPEIERLRGHGLTDHVLVWPDVLHNFLCGRSEKFGLSEWDVVVTAVNNQMPLGEVEIIEGMAFFRVDLQQYLSQRLAEITRASVAKKDGQNTPKPAHGRDGSSAGVGLPDGNDGEPEPELVGGIAG